MLNSDLNSLKVSKACTLNPFLQKTQKGKSYEADYGVHPRLRMAAALMGCKGKSEVKTKSADDQPFGVYQGGIDRAKQVQQQADQRTAKQDSVALQPRTRRVSLQFWQY